MTPEIPFVTQWRREWEQGNNGGAWLLNEAVRTRVGNTGIDNKKLVLAACACVRLVLHLLPEGETRPQTAIQTAEAWAHGKTGLEQVRATYKAAASVSSRARQAWTDAAERDFTEQERAACIFSVTDASALVGAAVLRNIRYVVSAVKQCVYAGVFANYGDRHGEYELMQLRCSDAVRAIIPWADIMPAYLAWYGYGTQIT